MHQKILVICPYPVDKAAGQRLKYEQYITHWQQQGYIVTIKPFMTPGLYRIVHQQGNIIAKIAFTIWGIISRLWLCLFVPRYSMVYIFMYVSPLGGNWFEALYCRLAKKVIFDLEDNRLLGSSKETSGLAQKLRSTAKTEYLVKHAHHVITSSPDLNEICLGINKYMQCTYVPASIDTDRFVPVNTYDNNDTVVIGWTGTFSTKPYLDLLRPMFIELSKHRQFKLLVIGNFDYEFPEINMQYVPWSAAQEVALMQQIDIGVYPLPIDDEWIGGKSGLKAIQYMAFGVPAVCTNIGNVQRFIIHNVNGVLVNTQQQWVEALIQLIDKPTERKRVGEAGRNTVLQQFSKQVVAKQYLKIIQHTI
jgi:L-malate glycosyltransferase